MPTNEWETVNNRDVTRYTLSEPSVPVQASGLSPQAIEELLQNPDLDARVRKTLEREAAQHPQVSIADRKLARTKRREDEELARQRAEQQSNEA